MPEIATIGYEGLPPDALVELLQARGIRLLADLRAIANSRKPGYSKKALAARLEAAGIAYRHFRDLGTPAAGREANHAGRMAEFRRIYADQLARPEAQAALAELAGLARAVPTCLLCLEADPARCHRSLVAAALEPGGFSVAHLHPPEI